jgi:hypothetical protein
MSDGRKKRGVWPWVVTVLIGLPVLYVLSSGPMQTLAFRRTIETPAFRVTTWRPPRWIVSTDRGYWWPTVYAPIVWVSEQSWGEPVKWYWGLFPIREPVRFP